MYITNKFFIGAMKTLQIENICVVSFIYHLVLLDIGL